METRTHIQTLLTTISQGLYEKEHILALALLCAISGESCFLLGPPGTAKSEIARRLKLIFKDASAFEYLMSRFSTPDEIFGPVSIQKLKSEDTYERKVDGFLPSATIVFLDEIWKAGPAIQNALLTVINERIYRNGTNTLQLPMKCLIAASNELPAEDEGLEALWDRFLVRIVSNCIEDEDTFLKMLNMQQLPSIVVPDELKITNALYDQWQQQILQVTIPEDIQQAILVKRLLHILAAREEKEGDPRDYYISDRRWCKVIHLLRASAFLNGRQEIDFSDFILLFHTNWNKSEKIEYNLHAVVSAIFSSIENECATIDYKLDKSLKKRTDEKWDAETQNYKKFDFFYLGLANHPNGKCFFQETDYKYIPRQGVAKGIMYFDSRMNAYVIRHYDKSLKAFDTSGKQNVRTVTLSKCPGGLLIDAVPYQFVRSSDSPSNTPQVPQEYTSVLQRCLELKQLLQQRLHAITTSNNLFVTKHDLALVSAQAKAVDKAIDITIAKLRTL